MGSCNFASLLEEFNWAHLFQIALEIMWLLVLVELSGVQFDLKTNT